MPMKIDTCWVISKVAKVTPKISPRYLLRSPVSIRSAIQFMDVSISSRAATDLTAGRVHHAGQPRESHQCLSLSCHVGCVTAVGESEDDAKVGNSPREILRPAGTWT